MMPAAGTFAELVVSREAPPFGFFLAGKERDILLHYSEMTEDVRPGDKVRVFLFHDSEDRLAATMRTPLAALGDLALLKVADVHPQLGCFLEIGLSRHLLLPASELPEHPELRPAVGDRVFVLLKHDKQGRLIGKAAGERELAKLAFRAPQSWKNTWQDAIVYKSLKSASFAICPGGVLGFGAIGMIHETERTRPLRMGETVPVRVTFVREDGRVNLSMRRPKAESREEDAERLLAFLRERPNGAMPYSDETPPDIIKQRFQMSKAAFKRAIGKLMKEGLVEQKGSWTYLKDRE